MSLFETRRRIYRLPAQVLIVGQLWLPLPAEAAERRGAEVRGGEVAVSAAVATPAPEPAAKPPVKANRTVPKVTPPAAYPLFSEEPTTEEIFRARVFEEPLVPVGGAPDSDQNRALAQAISSELRAVRREDPQAFEAFLSAHAGTPWRASLLLNLGMVWRRAGYYSRALKAWDEAWELSKGQEDRYGKAVADRALGEWMEVSVQFGRVNELEKRVVEIEGRDVGGSAGEKVEVAKEGLAFFREHHQDAIPSGPAALDRILALGKPEYLTHPKVQAFPASHHGANLPQLVELSRSVGLPMQAAYRNPGAEVPAGSLLHWKLGHFSAVVRVERDSGQYLIHDPILGVEMWLSRRVLEEEGSGYMLVPAGALPAGFRAVGEKEGSQVRGKCGPKAPPGPNNNNNPGGPPQTGGGGGGNCGPNGCAQKPCPGMAVYSFHELMVSLSIRDIPVGYTPPRGPDVSFHLSYAQREGNQPQIFYYSNFGPKWTFDFMSHVIDNPGDLSQTVNVYLRGGGKEIHPNMGGGTSSIHPDSHAVLVRTGTSPIRYERRLPDGSVEVFAQADGAATYSRRVFMTESIDAQGNKLSFTYDGQLRLVAITDAIGQVTMLSHELTADPLKITKVTDPFGRFATFEYDEQGRLIKITDVIGLSSEFDYGPGDFIQALTTPYGTTSFSKGEGGTYWRTLEATDPLGGQERLEYRYYTPEIPNTEPAAAVPSGMGEQNVSLSYANSFFWDKRAMALAPGDYTKAHISKWLLGSSGFEKVRHSDKSALERRIWYSYGGNSYSTYVGTQWQPTKIARVLDDGQSQIWRREYNSQGRRIRETDPLGRTVLFTYDSSGTDLTQVRVANGSSADLMQSLSYNAQHQPLTITDAAGQTTTFTYTDRGQLFTLTTPARAGVTEDRTTHYSYDDEGYVQSISAPGGAQASQTYDDYGRVRTSTEMDGYVLTFDYDALDRPIKVSHPDGSYEATVYNRLDAERQRDRLGRWSHTLRDALRRVVATRDAAGRLIRQEWCACGTLDRMVDARGHATSWERDLQGRPTREVRTDGSSRSFEYDLKGRLTKVVDAKLQEKRSIYGLDDRLASINYVNAEHPTPAVAFSYLDPATGAPDAHGRLRRVTDGTGATTYAYHPIVGSSAPGAGQLESIDGPRPDDVMGYGYDELGRVVSRSLGGRTTSWRFDSLGRIDRQVEAIGTFSYGYVGTTALLRDVTYPNSQTTTYDYAPANEASRLREIHHRKPDGATLSRFTYVHDALGNVRTWTQEYAEAPPRAYEFSYDPANQLLEATYRTVEAAPTVVKRYAYAYDPAGNRTAEQIDDQLTGATYDGLNRLLSQQPGGPLLFKGSLDEPASVMVQGASAEVTADNRFAGRAPAASGTSPVTISATDPNGNTRTNVYQVTQGGASRSFGYDANGNVTSDGARSYEWDAENRLLAVKQGALTLASFSYDGLGRRATKTAAGVATAYIYDGAQFLEERSGTSAPTVYVYGYEVDSVLAQIAGGTTTFYVSDHLGSVVQATGAAGAVVSTRQYDPWGNPLPGTTSGFAFTGREWDAETGLYFYRARYYDPRAGRFLSADPIEAGSNENYYAYVENQPGLLRDPFGLDAITSDKTICECFCAMWKDAGYGVWDTERAAWIISGGDAYSCHRWPYTAQSKKETWKGPIPAGAVAIAHTHPTRSTVSKASPRPSTGDEETAKKVKMPVYVVSDDGVWKYDPATKKTTQEETEDPCKCKK